MECVSCGAELEPDQDQLCPDCQSAGSDDEDTDTDTDEDDDDFGSDEDEE